MTDNPVLAEATRGDIVESAHRGALAVFDADGACVLALGDIERPVFPRSAVKGIQALALLESGAADLYDLTPGEIALACSSHSGEPAHAAASARMLKKSGRTFACLECGTHWPMNEAAAHDLARSGKEPTALHNNCSGKHAGFICAAVAMQEDPQGYVRPDHPLQREVTATLAQVLKVDFSRAPMGIDGCAIPTYGVPLKALAYGFARYGAGTGFEPVRAKSIRRIRAACAAEPFMVAGTGRFDTRIMTALRERAFTKTGAEGVYCAALPEQGLGIAIKIDDGATRASEAAMASLIARFLTLDAQEGAVIQAAIDAPIRNRNGDVVGHVRPSHSLRRALG